ncbi:hypothetical protein [Dethiothermospora halolimnae]|uniref:hypothetical protein n=1 Tax=Dethiothermospora halolimnae TaxID=3114390 RepID=UPI003CCB817A
MKKFYFNKNMKKILGIVFGVIGSIVIIQVVPLKIWIFLLGALLIGLGWCFFKMF